MAANPTTMTEKADVYALRQFGWMMAGAIAVVFGLVIPWLWNLAWPRWPWMFAAVLVMWATLWPRGLGPVFRFWMKLAHVLGWINTRLVLGLVFYGLIAPIGILMRLVGHDPLRRRWDAMRQSYRIDSTNPPPDHMERPY